MDYIKIRIYLVTIILLLIPSCSYQNNAYNKELSLPSIIIDDIAKACSEKNSTMNKWVNELQDEYFYDHSFDYTLDAASKIDEFTLDTVWIENNFKSEGGNNHDDFINTEYKTDLKLFPKEEGFELYDRYSYLPKIYAGIYKENDTYYPAMFVSYNSTSRENNSAPQSQLSIIKYKNMYAYEHECISRYKHDVFYNFLYLLTFMDENDNPFEIYFSSVANEWYKFFLIPKNEEFKSKCISRLENEPGMQYFNIEQAREIINKKEEERLFAKTRGHTIHYFAFSK